MYERNDIHQILGCIEMFLLHLGWVVALTSCPLLIECRRGPHHPREDPLPPGTHPHHHPSAYKLTEDENLMHDKAHLQEDIGQPINDMSDEELEFYYFSLHDFDGNAHLDGLEMLKAIFHTIDHEHLTSDTEYHSYSDEVIKEYIGVIDKVLTEDDSNNDGLISYAEFVKSRLSTKSQKFSPNDFAQDD